MGLGAGDTTWPAAALDLDGGGGQGMGGGNLELSPGMPMMHQRPARIVCSSEAFD